jgi:hypothetical protein
MDMYMKILTRRKWKGKIAAAAEGMHVITLREKSTRQEIVVLVRVQDTMFLLMSKTPSLTEREVQQVLMENTPGGPLLTPMGIDNWGMSASGVIRHRQKGRDITSGISVRKMNSLIDRLVEERNSFMTGRKSSILPTSAVLSANCDGTISLLITTRTFDNLDNSQVRAVTEVETRLHSGDIVRETLYDSFTGVHDAYLPPTQITLKSGRQDKNVARCVQILTNILSRDTIPV